jgi:hypothetical protein
LERLIVPEIGFIIKLQVAVRNNGSGAGTVRLVTKMAWNGQTLAHGVSAKVLGHMLLGIVLQLQLQLQLHFVLPLENPCSANTATEKLCCIWRQIVLQGSAFLVNVTLVI